MRRITLLFIFFIVSTGLFGQKMKPEKCDYAMLYKQGIQAAKDSLFDKALLCFNSARRCDLSKVKEIDEAINRVFAGIQKQKQTAIDERKRAEAQTQLATLQKKLAENQKDSAKLERNRAEEQRLTAERQARAAKNAATAIAMRDTNPTLALQMLHYNIYKQPNEELSSLVKSQFARILKDTTQAYIKKILTGHQGTVYAMCLSANEKYLITGSADGIVKVWLTKTGENIKTFKAHDREVLAVAISPNGKYLATGGDKIVKLWSFETTELEKTLAGHHDILYALAFTKDNNHLISGGNDGRALLWSIETGEILKTFTGHYQGILAMALSSDERYLATGSDDTTIKIWSIGTGNVIKTIEGENVINAVAFSKDNKYLAFGDDYKVKIWNLDSNKIEKVFYDKKNVIKSIDFTADGHSIAAGMDDGRTLVWSLETGLVDKILIGHLNIVTSVIFHNNSQNIFTCSHDSSIIQWSLEANKPTKTIYYDKYDDKIAAARISPDGKYLAIGKGSIVSIMVLETGEIIRNFQINRTRINGLSISSDNKFLFTSSNDNVIRSWFIETGELYKVFEENKNFSTFILSGNDKYIVEAYKGIIALKKIGEEQLSKVFVDSSNTLYDPSISYDGKFLLTFSENEDKSIGSIKIWSLQNDHFEGSNNIYIYPWYKFQDVGFQLEYKDSLTAIKERQGQNAVTDRVKMEFESLMATWQTTPQYQIDISLMDSLMNKIPNLQDITLKIDNAKDTFQLFKLYSELNDSLEIYYSRHSFLYYFKLIESYLQKARYALFVKKFDIAEKTCKRSLELDSRKTEIKLELAHALLFQSKYNEALKIYHNYIDAPSPYPDKTNIEVLIKDFEELEAAGITHKDIPKIKAALKAKKE